MAHLAQTATLIDSDPYSISLGFADARPPYLADGGDLYPAFGTDSAFSRNISLGPVCGNVFNGEILGLERAPMYVDAEHEVRGTVLDAADNPMARNVVVTTRYGYKIGFTRSNPDGTFRVLCPGLGYGRVLVAAIPDDGDFRNAVVKWFVVPVPRSAP